MRNTYRNVESGRFFSRIGIALLLGVFFSTHLFAQEFAINLGRTSGAVDVVTDNMQQLRVNYSYPGINTFGVKSDKGLFNEIYIPNTYWVGELGTPKLPASKNLIEIPFGAEVSVKVLGYTVSEHRLGDHGIEHLLMPVQPSVRKDQNVDEIPFEFKPEIYEQDVFIGHELATVEILGNLRGYRIARLTVAPVSYNPAQGKIRVYNDIDVEITFHNADLQLTEYIKASTYSPYFEIVQNSLLNNPNHGYPNHPDLTKYPVKYLIVSHRMFENELVPFVEWKTKKGFEVVLAFTDEIGTSYAAIQSWVHAQYNAGTPTDPAPSFLLLVGGPQQVPSIIGSSSSRVTDLYYASVDGDMLPEMYYGRFSATNTAQLVSQINKTLYYEKYEFADPSFLDKVTLIAGADGTWNPRIGQPTIHYGTNNHWNAANGFTGIHTYLTAPYTGCYDPSRIAVSFINFTAHCSQTSWSSPTLSVSDVHNFVNAGQYPLAIGNCCQSADFNHTESIGEAWARANNKGAVAYIGAAPNTYWFEDFYWAVGAFPLQGTNNGYVPTYQETTWGAYDAPFVSNYVTAGAIMLVGNLAVTEVHIQGYPTHSSPLYYWQAYNVLGDPSIVTFNTQGGTNMVSHMPILPIGLNTYEVTAAPGSYVGISKDGVLHGAALVGPSGNVEVPIQPVLSSGMVDIVVTKPQYIPYMVQVPAAALEGPYVVLDSFIINDETGNNNGLADYGEDINLHVTLKNVGADPSAAVVATFTGSDPYVTLTSTPAQIFGIIVNGETATVQNAYSLTIADYVPDQHMASFTLEITDGTDSWSSSLHIIVHAPAFSIANNLIIDDSVGGNNNGQADPGEIINILVANTNTGNSHAFDLTGTISSSNPYITINNNEDTLETLESGQTAHMVFNISIDEDTPIGTPVLILYEVSAGDYFASKEFIITVGLIIEDFETGDFTAFPWYSAGNLPWTITNVDPYEGIYSAKSGAITHNQSSQLILDYDVGAADSISFYRKVSSESNYDFLKFYINNTVVGQWSGSVAWGRVVFPVTPGVKTFKWEYMKDGSVSTGSDCAWIDYIIFPPPAACPSPVNLHATAVTSGTATLNWSPGGSEDLWDVIWGPAGFDPNNSGTMIPGVTVNHHGLTGLQAVTAYHFYVRSHCNGDMTSAWSGPGAFTTLCDIFTLPYVEPFGTPAVTCWSFPQGQGNWAFGTSYTPPSSTSGAPNAFFNWSPSTTNYSFSLTSPLIDATNFSVIKLDYILFLNSFSSSTVEYMAVEFKTLEATEWTLLEMFSNAGLGSGNAEYIRVDQELSGVAGSQFQVRFRAHGANSYNLNGWGLDDIHVHGEQGGPVVLPGDSNCDGVVNVLDAITTVNYVMGTNPEPFCWENADVTGDGVINVLDVIGTVNIIMGGKKTSPFEVNSATAHIFLNRNGIQLESDGTLAGLQFEITGMEAESLNLLLNGYEFVTANVDEKVIGMIFSFDNNPLPAGKIKLISFDSEILPQWGSVIAGNLNAEEVPVEKHIAGDKPETAGQFTVKAYPNPTAGITTIAVTTPLRSQLSIKIFDMHGREISQIAETLVERGVHHFIANENQALRSGIYTLQMIIAPIDQPGNVYRKNIKLVIQ